MEFHHFLITDATHGCTAFPNSKMTTARLRRRMCVLPRHWMNQGTVTDWFQVMGVFFAFERQWWRVTHVLDSCFLNDTLSSTVYVLDSACYRCYTVNQYLLCISYCILYLLVFSIGSCALAILSLRFLIYKISQWGSVSQSCWSAGDRKDILCLTSTCWCK